MRNNVKSYAPELTIRGRKGVFICGIELVMGSITYICSYV